jgi:P2 family phage contractile tail tube protein
MTVHYYKLEVDGEEIIEIDTLNNIYKIRGEDKLADYTSAIGG